jgi:protein-tyrosine phosphatase
MRTLHLSATVDAAGSPWADAVREAAAVLARGLAVVLPTETVPGLAVLPAEIARLRDLKGRDAEQPVTHHTASLDGAVRAGAVLAGPAARLAARSWPGPLTLVVPARHGGTIGVRVPAHPFTRAVIAASGSPSLLMTSVNRSGQPPLVLEPDIRKEFGDRIELAVFAAEPPSGVASTVVRIVGPEIEILREGALDRATIVRRAARSIVFVCTGNTCRSPLAEAIARDRIARGLGVRGDELEGHGIHLASAGIATAGGSPASEGSRQVARELGLSLDDHRSRPLEPSMVREADFVYCLAETHLDAARALHPHDATRIALLDPAGRGIPDPFGGDLEDYRHAGAAIAAAIEQRLPAMLASSS